jgi:hypothetical protein
MADRNWVRKLLLKGKRKGHARTSKGRYLGEYLNALSGAADVRGIGTGLRGVCGVTEVVRLGLQLRGHLCACTACRALTFCVV